MPSRHRCDSGPNLSSFGPRRGVSRVDGVVTRPRRRDAVDAAVRESTPREGEPRPCRDGLATQVFVLLILIGFREEVQMTKLYNIKNNDMLYFLLFSVVLIPFQFIADVSDSEQKMNLNLTWSRRWRLHETAPPRRRRCGRQSAHAPRERAATVP